MSIATGAMVWRCGMVGCDSGSFFAPSRCCRARANHVRRYSTRDTPWDKNRWGPRALRPVQVADGDGGPEAARVQHDTIQYLTIQYTRSGSSYQPGGSMTTGLRARLHRGSESTGLAPPPILFKQATATMSSLVRLALSRLRVALPQHHGRLRRNAVVPPWRHIKVETWHYDEDNYMGRVIAMVGVEEKTRTTCTYVPAHKCLW